MEPTPVFLPGKYHGQSSLVGFSTCGHKESNMSEQLTLIHFALKCQALHEACSNKYHIYSFYLGPLFLKDLKLSFTMS